MSGHIDNAVLIGPKDGYFMAVHIIDNEAVKRATFETRDEAERVAGEWMNTPQAKADTRRNEYREKELRK